MLLVQCFQLVTVLVGELIVRWERTVIAFACERGYARLTPLRRGERAGVLADLRGGLGRLWCAARLGR